MLAVCAAALAGGAFGPLRIGDGLPGAEQASLVPAQGYGDASSVAGDVARWASLKSSDNLPFASYASFLTTHRGWPGEAAMRRNAEKQIDMATVSPAEALRYFAVQPPTTPGGHAKYALALLANGETAQARAAARAAWVAGAMNPAEESRLLGAFGPALTQADHDARMDVLLDNRDLQSAQRLLPMTSMARRPVHEARIALQTRAADAANKVTLAGTAAFNDAGLLMDRANYMRATGGSQAARELLARPRQLLAPPRNAERWLETNVAVARAAAEDRQWSLVNQIAMQVTDTYPAGTDVSRRSFGERDEYTNLTWLGGTAARQLGQPAQAAVHFERYGRAAQSAQTRSKGLYWAGRAAQGAGNAAGANAYFQEAARLPDQFHGQLAIERLGLTVPAPATPAVQPTAAERLAFNTRPIVAAARWLGQNGRWRDQTEFVRAISASADSDADRLLAAQFGQEVGRPDLGVMLSRRPKANGGFEYVRWGFPELRVPAGYAPLTAIIHGITRQESMFDREAQSHVGARGLMQLMPGTAQETARRMGMPYELGRLTRDADYNVMLGSKYFSDLLSQWGGNHILAVASYNAGAGNVRRWVRANGDPRLPGVDPVEWVEAIPFSETRGYVQRVLENAVVYDTMFPAQARSPQRGRLSWYLGRNGATG